MKATEAKLLQILSAVSQFIIPIYQRTYSWTLKECQQLWADILRVGSTEEIGVHFIGSVVHIDEGLGNLAVQAPELVIAEERASACIGCQNGQVRLLSSTKSFLLSKRLRMVPIASVLWGRRFIPRRIASTSSTRRFATRYIAISMKGRLSR
jgi:hypothetical protein